MDIFDKKKWVVVDLPDAALQNMIYTYIYTLYFYGSPDYKNTYLHYRKMVLTKKNTLFMCVFP